jgi:hypothetical protein
MCSMHGLLAYVFYAQSLVIGGYSTAGHSLHVWVPLLDIRQQLQHVLHLVSLRLCIVEILCPRSAVVKNLRPSKISTHPKGMSQPLFLTFLCNRLCNCEGCCLSQLLSMLPQCCSQYCPSRLLSLGLAGCSITWCTEAPLILRRYRGTPMHWAYRDTI